MYLVLMYREGKIQTIKKRINHSAYIATTNLDSCSKFANKEYAKNIFFEHFAPLGFELLSIVSI